MEIVDDKTLVEVGKYYNVRCYVFEGRRGEKIYVPILGKPHTDPQFGVHSEHYHIDGRFAKEADRFNVNENGQTNAILATDSYDFKGVEIKRRRCKRITTGINPPERTSPSGSRYWQWHDSMIGKSCKGRKCPHLGTTMREEKGMLVCPLHNLHGSIEKEIIINPEIP